MASEFQRGKVEGVFRAMDDDGDGFLRREDFQALSDRWTELRGAAADSADHARLSGVMLGWWSALSAAADPTRNDRVTLDEVLLVVDRLGAMTDAVEATATSMFDAVDENGDGEISPAEYHRMIHAWSGVETETDDVFPLLDGNGDGHLSRDEFTALWSEFWAGDDPTSPGTWVFGRFDLPATTA